jgi:hypothetical protein
LLVKDGAGAESLVFAAVLALALPGCQVFRLVGATSRMLFFLEKGLLLLKNPDFFLRTFLSVGVGGSAAFTGATT